MKLILLGPPGAGKGTLAALLRDRLGIVHISTGDLLREEMKNNTPLGKSTKTYVEKGELVPDEVVIKMIEQKMMTDKNIQKGYLLDGFPRTRIQAQQLDRILNKVKQPVDYALYMHATLPVIIQRLTGRRVCKDCGALYHIKNKPPQIVDKCDSCGGALYQRSDDNEKTIEKRMKVYLESTSPIIEYYEAEDKLLKVNADEEADFVLGDLMKLFDEDKRSNNDQNRR